MDSFAERFEWPRALSPEADSSLFGGRRDEGNGRMIEANGLHPSPERLSDFALGKLGEDQIPMVARHVSDCAVCRDTAAATTDPFVDLLRPDSSDPLDSHVLPDALRHHCRYRIIRCLGRGGMGTVYLAEHRLMKQQRAIKVINPTLIGNDRAVERFVREVELLPRLHHPTIVQAHDAEKADGLYLLVMEYVEGETLAELVERCGPLQLGTACEYSRQAAVGLQYAHEQGLVHRDIKPSNLMRTNAGQIKILDFGLARLASESGATGLTHEHATMGTPDYAAPEQALDAHNTSSTTDIYSLGCTLFYLLTGTPPFGKPSALAVFAAHLHEPPPSLRALRPNAPAALCDLVDRMLSKLPNQRPQTPAEVAACLAPFLIPEVPPAKDDVPAKAGAFGSRNRALRWAMVALGFFSAVALIVWATVVFQVRTPDGTIVLEQVPDGAEVFVDGRRIDVRLPGDKETVRIEAPPGKRELKITKGSFQAFTKQITLLAGKTETIKVNLTQPKEAEAKPPEADEKGWIPLFNGKDLTGWKTFDGGTAGWKVEGGAIIGQGELPVLFSQSNAFEDFHLRVEAMINDGGSSGILFRSPFVPYGPHAYHARIGLTQRFAQQTGSLSDLGPYYRKLHKPNEWFTLEVLARGEHIVLKLNGVTTVDLQDARFQKGHIDLDANHPPTVVRFRKIAVKKLPALDEP
jgi:tRNA A-37 threonylcarbamoyl transferase component Bud32